MTSTVGKLMEISNDGSACFECLTGDSGSGYTPYVSPAIPGAQFALVSGTDYRTLEGWGGTYPVSGGPATPVALPALVGFVPAAGNTLYSVPVSVDYEGSLYVFLGRPIGGGTASNYSVTFQLLSGSTVLTSFASYTKTVTASSGRAYTLTMDASGNVTVSTLNDSTSFAPVAICINFVCQPGVSNVTSIVVSYPGTGESFLAVQALCMVAEASLVEIASCAATPALASQVDISGGGFKPMYSWGTAQGPPSTPTSANFLGPATTSACTASTSWNALTCGGAVAASGSSLAVYSLSVSDEDYGQRFNLYLGSTNTADVAVNATIATVAVSAFSPVSVTAASDLLFFQTPVTGPAAAVVTNEWTLASVATVPWLPTTNAYFGVSVQRAQVSSGPSSVLKLIAAISLSTTLDGVQFACTQSSGLNLQAISGFILPAPPGPTELNLSVATSGDTFHVFPVVFEGSGTAGTLVDPLSCNVMQVKTDTAIPAQTRFQVLGFNQLESKNTTPPTAPSAQSTYSIDTAGFKHVFTAVSPTPDYAFVTTQAGSNLTRCYVVTSTVSADFELVLGSPAQEIEAYGVTQFGAVAIAPAPSSTSSMLYLSYPSSTSQALFVSAGFVNVSPAPSSVLSASLNLASYTIVQSLILFNGTVFLSVTKGAASMVLVCSFSGWGVAPPAWTITEVPLSFQPTLLSPVSVASIVAADSVEQVLVTNAGAVHTVAAGSEVPTPSGAFFALLNSYAVWFSSTVTSMTVFDFNPIAFATKTIALPSHDAFVLAPVLAYNGLQGGDQIADFVFAGNTTASCYRLQVKFTMGPLSGVSVVGFTSLSSLFTQYPTSSILSMTSMTVPGSDTQSWFGAFTTGSSSGGATLLLRQTRLIP